MRKQLAPYLILLSLAANLFLGMQLYNRDLWLNRSTWGYAVNTFWKDINTASLMIGARSDGRVLGSNVEGVWEALEDLQAMQYLHFYEHRVSDEDISTIRQFLRYAQAAHALALKEQGETGTATPQSVERLQRIHDGLELVLHGQVVTNELTNSRNPWNHAKWRQMWRGIAETLRKLDFIPLPE